MRKYEEKRDFVRAAICLDQQTTWDAQVGALAVLEGNDSGWALLDRVLHYRWWRYRVSIQGEFASRVALVLAHAIVFEEDGKADWLADRLICASMSTEYELIGWELTSMPGLILWLWSKLRGRTPPEGVRLARREPYERIVATWEEPPALHEAILLACDHHLDDAMMAMSGKGYPEFGTTPYDVFPVELLALSRVRSVLGLMPIAFEHPLLSTHLAAPVRATVRPHMESDAVLEAFVKKVCAAGMVSEQSDGV
jgi:hypothetical protein